MGHIIRVSEEWEREEVSFLLEELREKGHGDAIVIMDEEAQVFEYDDLEDVTLYEDEIAEELGIEDTDDVKFLDNNSLNDGME
jgi:hypothetical protein